MSRPSLRLQRRRELAAAFARVLAAHGQEGATIAALAAESGVAPGLIHHYFADKQDLYGELLDMLIDGFRRRLEQAMGDRLQAYGDAALALEGGDVVAARAWMGLFAQALGDRALFKRLRRLLDAEILYIERRAGGTLAKADASAILAFVIGALVFGAFAPRTTAGFAAPAFRRLLAGLRGARSEESQQG